MQLTKTGLKEPLSFIIKNRRGYQRDLKPYSAYVDSFRMVGFINMGHTLKADTYSVTNLADNYYKDLYGGTLYYIQRLKVFFGKLFK